MREREREGGREREREGGRERERELRVERGKVGEKKEIHTHTHTHTHTHKHTHRMPDKFIQLNQLKIDNSSNALNFSTPLYRFLFRIMLFFRITYFCNKKKLSCQFGEAGVSIIMVIFQDSGVHWGVSW